LATIREEVSDIRTRQEELYEVLIGYKEQLQELKGSVVDGLAGLPKSPYIAGQLVPAPDGIGGVDDFRQLLATYLHGAPPATEDEPVDVTIDPPAEVNPDDVKLEPDEDRPRSKTRGNGRGRRTRSDSDDGDGGAKKTKKKRRRRAPRKKKAEATED
jgi:hypothetical protein